MCHPEHILITGASSGLGAALALAYAAPARHLVLHGRNAERLVAVANKVRRLGANVVTHCGDVRDAAALKTLIESIDTQRPIDLVIANAGISAGTGQGGETPEQSEAIFATNLDGVLNTVRPAVDVMRQRGSGQIAIMSSLAGFCGLPGAPSYSACKAAVRIYGEALRGDMKPYGVSVNVICPGFVRTPMTARNPYAMPFIITAEQAAQIIQKGLVANKAQIAFPWPMAFSVKALAALPAGLREWILSYAPRKPAFNDRP